MHKGWLAAGGNHPVCIRFLKSNEKSTEYVYSFVFLLGIYTGQTYIHSVYMRCGFPKNIHAQYDTGFWENLYTYKSPCMYTCTVCIRGLTYILMSRGAVLVTSLLFAALRAEHCCTPEAPLRGVQGMYRTVRYHTAPYRTVRGTV